MTSFSPVTHVIFDMDGLLLDTETLYERAGEIVVSKYGKEFSFKIQEAVMGLSARDDARYVTETLSLPLSIDEYLRKLAEVHQQLFPKSELMKGAEKLVRHLSKHNIPIAIASGGAQDSYELKTTNHREFVKLFRHVVLASTDPEVKNGKPAPDVFLICAGRFPDQPKPENCLVFEDAPNGVEAAVAAKMQVVMVPDSRLNPELSKGATQVLSSLEEFKPELFGLPAYD